MESHAPKSNEKVQYSVDPKTHNKYRQLMSTIPRRKGAWGVHRYQYEGFWYGSNHLEGMLFAQDHFKPKPNDVILSSALKSGLRL